jgi:hypothetical protein
MISMISPCFEAYLQKKGYKYENRLLADSNGLIFFNLLTTRDFRHGEGEEIGPGEFLQG